MTQPLRGFAPSSPKDAGTGCVHARHRPERRPYKINRMNGFSRPGPGFVLENAKSPNPL